MVKAKIRMDFAKLKQTFRNHESASFQDTSRTFWAGSKAQSESKSRPSASLGGRRRLKEETRFYVVQQRVIHVWQVKFPGACFICSLIMFQHV